jgi:hypothetical protein
VKGTFTPELSNMLGTQKDRASRRRTPGLRSPVTRSEDTGCRGGGACYASRPPCPRQATSQPVT